MTIIIEDIPPSLNKFAGRQNVWEYRSEKAIWKTLIKAKVKKPVTKFSKAIVHIHYIFPTRIRRDPDNYNGKMIMDGLVEAGVLKDDSFDCVELRLSAQYIKGIKRTIVEITNGN